MDAILRAGLHAFAETGFYGASVRDVARRAGTSLSNLYNYFPSKEDLLVAVLENANTQLREEIDAAMEGAGTSATQQVTAAVSALVRFATERQDASLIAITEIRYLTGDKRRALVEQRDSTQQVIEDAVEQGIATGEFATSSSKDSTRAILTMSLSIASWYREDGTHSVAQLERIYRSYALGILRTAIT